MYEQFEKRIDEIMSKMTLREKLGQLNQRETPKDDQKEAFFEMARKGELGSILMSVGSTAGNTPQGDIDVDFYNELQRIAVEESESGIPIIFGRDVIHGHRTCYPIPLAMAAAFNPELVKKAYRETSKEAANDSVHWSFAPMLDLSRDPRWGRIIEGAGEDPFVAADMARAVVAGFQGDDPAGDGNLLACAKHFIGYGAAEGGRDYCHTEISDYSLYNFYLPAFKAAVDAGVATVMSSFNDVNGEPVSGSRYYLTEILRDYLGFEGTLVSDYGAVHMLISHGVAADKKEATKIGIEAGVDMDMWDSYYLDEGEALVASGELSMETVDTAVRRVLRIKFLKGLFENPYCVRKEIDCAPHRETARELAGECMVLLKNNDKLLPLSKDSKILLSGPYAEDRRTHLGSWSLDSKEEETPNLLEELNNALCGKGSVELRDITDNDSTDADVVLLALGEEWTVTGENAAVSHISISEPQKQLIRNARKLGKKVVGVFFCGRPIAMSGLADELDAVLYAWHSGTCACGAVCDILFGDRVPSGSLPATLPRLATHIPLYYNIYSSGHEANTYYGDHMWGCYSDSKATPYYPFGYGLSYTEFKYGDIVCDKREISLDALTKGEKFTFSVDVTNAGDFDGKENVQVYIRDVAAKISRPMRELKAYKKELIKKGETKTFTFELGAEELGYYDQRGNYVIEKGDFEFYVGRDCLTERKITVKLV